MDMDDAKADLHRYLKVARESMVWKLEGLSEYDLRRPLTRTGTNLLGLIKHVASVEVGYLGDTFGRPAPMALPWFAPDAPPNDDFWATPEESKESIVAFYQQVWAHDDETVRLLPLDAEGEVPWWPEERRKVTLHRVLVHVTTETHRHAGHADIVRELVDGAAGLRADNSNLWAGEGDDYWASYCARLEAVARQAAGMPPA